MNYEKVYYDLIQKAKDQNRKKEKNTYYEAHHIVPKCLGGTGSYSKNKPHSNIILLTGREHFIAHLLLHKIYPKNRPLLYACWRMCNMQTKLREHHKPSARTYEEIKANISKTNKTIVVSNEVRVKISNTMSGRPAHNKGKKMPEEVLYKWRKSQPKIQCTKCGKVGGGHAMKRFHFENCGLVKVPLKEVQCPYCKKVGKGSMMKRWHFNNCKNQIK